MANKTKDFAICKPGMSLFFFLMLSSFSFCLQSIVLYIQLVWSPLAFCHRVFFFAYWTSWPETSAIGSAEETSLEKVVWISGRRVERTKKKREQPSVYFSLSLLVCLLLSNQHLLLGRRRYQPCTSWLCKAPSAFPDGVRSIWGAVAPHVLLCVPPHGRGVGGGGYWWGSDLCSPSGK